MQTTMNDPETAVANDPQNDVEPENGEAPTGGDEITQAAKAARKRQHGKGFIYWSLRDADDALRKIDHHAKRMSKDGFARALGHKKAEGRFFNKLDALKLYKLAEDDADDVVLTGLAVDMLYGGSEATRTKARSTAFLSYEDFSKTFAECPKGQDHPLEYVIDFVKGKLGIANEVDRFKRLFLESAHFAGLIEGELDPAAKTIRLRHATPQSTGSDSTSTTSGERKSESGFEVIGGNQAAEMLAAFGLSSYADRAEVAQKVSGRVSQRYDEGQLTLEVNRPIRVVIKNTDLLMDLPEIVKAMRQKGLAI